MTHFIWKRTVRYPSRSGYNNIQSFYWQREEAEKSVNNRLRQTETYTFGTDVNNYLVLVEREILHGK